jgi:hypothetical protein
MGHKFKISNLLGSKINRLTILKSFDRKYLVKCDCGVEKIVFAQDVYKEKTKSCGCLANEKITKHGKLKTNGNCLDKATYSCYSSMKQRCLNKKSTGYENYGGRGIKICPEWIASFEKFYKDMGQRPSLKHSIDRIDNDGDYNPENCRWSLHEEQMQHTSKTIQIKFGDVTKSLSYWCKFFGIGHKTVDCRVKRGMFKTYQEALTYPVYKTKRKND